MSFRLLLPPLLALVCLTANRAGSLAAQTTPSKGRPAEHIRVARLIRDLGSPSYQQREAANAQLARLGRDGREQLEKAAAHEDPEIRLRAKRLLRQVKIQQLWQGSPVQLVGTDLKVSDAMQQVVQQTGNDIAVGDQYGSYENTTITFDRRSGTFWQIVDEICQHSGNRIRLRYGTSRPGFVLVTGEVGQYPVAYAGAVRAQITDAKRVFVEEFDYKNQSSETIHTFQLNVLLTWENRLRLVAHQTQLTVDEAAARIPTRMLAQPANENGWQVAENSVRRFSSSLRLEPPTRGVQQLDRLRLRWEIMAVGDMDELEVAAEQSDKVHRQNDLAVVVEQLTQITNTRWELVVAVSREMVVPVPEEVLYVENEIELRDAAGRSFTQHARNPLGISDGTARVKLSFTAPTAESYPHRVVVRYPRIRDRRALPITFRGVPLPTAQPE